MDAPATMGTLVRRLYWWLWQRRSPFLLPLWRFHSLIWRAGHGRRLEQHLREEHGLRAIEPFRFWYWRKGRRGMRWYFATNAAGRRVFVKTTLHPGVIQNEASTLQTLREAYPNGLAHAGFPTVEAVGRCGRDRYLILEALHGTTLNYHRRDGTFDPARHEAAIVEGLPALLDALHEQGIVHRDFHANNVFLTDGDPVRLVLLDFSHAHQGGRTDIDVHRPSWLVRVARRVLGIAGEAAWDDVEDAIAMVDGLRDVLPVDVDMLSARLQPRRGRTVCTLATD